MSWVFKGSRVIAENDGQMVSPQRWDKLDPCTRPSVCATKPEMPEKETTHHALWFPSPMDSSELRSDLLETP